MNQIDEQLLESIADLHGTPAGAYNIRKNGAGVARQSSANIEIIPKQDKPGIDIIVKPHTKNESVHIPVIVTDTDRKSTRLNSSHDRQSRMPSSA